MIYHVSMHGAGNAGDIAILDMTQRLLRTLDKDIQEVKDYERQPQFDAPVVVGGGGLLIRDSFPNTASDWRWRISIDELQAIDQPVIVFGIGFNQFRGQADFNPIFSEHLRALVAKSLFFSLREKAGIPRLAPYIGDLFEKVRWQPCPASFMGKVYGDAYPGKYTVFAPAMDRIHLRGNIQRILPVLREIPNLKIALHMLLDRDFLRYVDFPCDVVDLSYRTAAHTVAFYNQASQVIGMRLHSCLIPFGLGVSVIPLISHDKLADWLIDIGHLEWGVELAWAETVREHLGKDQTDLAMRDRLYDITMKNLSEIKQGLEEK